MSYIDTCCLMTFIWHRDDMRIRKGLGSRKAESMVPRNHPEFRTPMPAVGEAMYKIMEKNCTAETMEAFSELDRLLRNGFLKTMYLRQDEQTFRLASRLMTIRNPDDRETISAMDALITASSAVDPECSTMYTEDQNLLYNGRLRREIDEWRSQNGYPSMSMRSLLKSIG